MVSKQTVEILIEAQENVSKVAKKAEEALKKMGNAGSQGMSKLTGIAGKIQNGFSKISSYVEKAREKFNALKNSSDKLGMIGSTISNAATSFGQLISSSNLAASAMEKIKSVSDGVQAKFTSLKGKITSFGSTAKSTLTNAFSLSNIKAKLTNLGTSIDNLKAKLRSLAAEAKKTGGSGGFGFLRNAASMTVGMLGYDLVNSVMETTRASLNARSGMQAFAQRLNMSGAEVQKFQSDLDTMQGSFKKIDMDVVGQQATDMAYRLGLPKQSLSELTETTAIFTDAMQRNGRSAEDSMLAMSDAMDGQFVRLKEIGIDQEKLMKNGWDGDIENKTGLLKAMNKSLKDLHYDDLAKSVDTLDDAYQVLNITLGNLLEQILVPLTPVIVGIVNALGDAISGIMDFVNNLKTGFSNLPEWAQIGIGIAAIALGVGIAVAAFGGLEAVIVTLLGPLVTLVGAITAISWPIVAAVAAIGLLVAAIYEIGKAFGWWTDVGSMFEAIGAGIQRMWNAFINHPDVQAAIAGITSALSWLSEAIGNAFNAILEFFGVSSSSNFDVVRAIMMALGETWDAFKWKIMAVIEVVTAVYNAISWVFSTIWSIVGPIIMNIVALVGSLIDAFTRFKNGQLSLPQLIMTVLTLLWNTYQNIISYIIGLVTRFASQMLSKAVTAGRNFVNGIINWLKQLPGKAYSALMAVVSKIVSAGAQWLSNAKTEAKNVVDGVYNTLSQIPGKVSSALSGVANAIAQPFKDAYKWVCDEVDKIKNKASELSGGIIALGGETEPLPVEANGSTNTVDVNTGETFNVADGSTVKNEPIEVNINQHLILDLANVPATIDTATLIRLLQDKTVLKELTNNSDFQFLDNKAKERLTYKIRRANGG